MANFTWPDILVLALYFVMVVGVGLYATCKANTSSAQGYFLAGQKSNWFLVGTSIFSTNVGTIMFIGMSGSAAASGMVVVMFEWYAMTTMVLLGWVFVPVYRASGCFTMPQYLQLRYGGGRIKMCFAIVGIFMSIVWYLSSYMYTGAIFIQQILDWNMYAAIMLILIVTAVYTVIGGLTAVMWTDAFQTFIMVGGATVVCIMGLVKVGGWSGILEKYPMAMSNQTATDVLLYGNRTCGLPRSDWNHIFRSIDSDYPWPGMLFGLKVLALFVWCNDQISVQRVLSAKSVSHAKAGLCLAAFLKITSFTCFVLPGLISRILYPDEVACADPKICKKLCGNPKGCSNLAYPLLVTRILPAGVRGLIFAAVMAGLMSTLTSIFNSASTLFTMDIYQKIRPHSKKTELMVVGRVFVLIMVGISIAWLPILEALQGSQFWAYMVSLSTYVFPPFVAAFLMGVFWKRTTEPGAFYGIMFGLGISIIRIGFDWSRQAPACGSNEPDTRFSIITRVHFMHYSIILCVLCCIFMAALSFMTKPRTERQLRRVTFWTRNDKREDEETDLKDKAQAEINTWKDSEADHPNEPDDEQLSLPRKFIYFICGIEHGTRSYKITEHQEEPQKTDIDEPKNTRRALDALGLFTVAVCVALHAYFH